MMLEAAAPESAWALIKVENIAPPTEEVVAQGLEAAKPFIAQLCAAQSDLAARAAKPARKARKGERRSPGSQPAKPARRAPRRK